MKRIAFVRWKDSTSTKRLEHGERLETAYIENAGIIIHEDPEDITLGFYWNWDEEKYTETVTIPKCSIKNIRRFKIE
tara:strand:+ start:2140 stop:2370 length:231 start_codon:yes stop_codon:yes gene_type:complete